MTLQILARPVLSNAPRHYNVYASHARQALMRCPGVRRKSSEGDIQIPGCIAIGTFWMVKGGYLPLVSCEKSETKLHNLSQYASATIPTFCKDIAEGKKQVLADYTLTGPSTYGFLFGNKHIVHIAISEEYDDLSQTLKALSNALSNEFKNGSSGVATLAISGRCPSAL